MNRCRLVPALVVAAALAAGCTSSARSAVSATGSADITTTTQSAQATDAPATDAPATDLPAGAYVSVITDGEVDNPQFDQFENDITRLLDQAGLPGGSLLVVQHGELVEQEAWLEYDLGTVVPIASGSKWLTAATIMTLVDDGVIALDSPISTYVPQTAGARVGAITMRQLLSFTSGLTSDEMVPCADDPAVTLQDCAAEMLRMGVVHAPGEVFRYGGQHLFVAAAIAEVVTGESFAQMFHDRIAAPLRMDHTAFLQVQTREYDPALVDHPSPAGSAVSTLGDYGRFLEMIYHRGVAPDGTRLLSDEAITEMQTNQIEDADYGAAAAFRVATEAPYGLGEWIDWTDAQGAATVLSSDGAFGFRPWIDYENDLFGVYLIDDRGEGYVEGDPFAPAADGGKVHTSGLWIFEWVAEALGGSLPEQQYPFRRR
ncbi:MAG: serine hydrolase domain-containing protein [Actinomycetota bacterium]|nr:serine hydrolase domain-containing protein [Actinomycetota bacterium]